jgi:uncharacterized membrane protein YfcA
MQAQRALVLAAFEGRAPEAGQPVGHTAPMLALPDVCEALLEIGYRTIQIAPVASNVPQYVERDDPWGRRLSQGKGGTLRPFGWVQAEIYLAIGVYAGLVVLGFGFFILAALVLLSGYDLRHVNAVKAFILLVVGLQDLFVFADRGEVDWVSGAPLVLGSALGAYMTARLATKAWTRLWVYRFPMLAVVASIGYLIMADSGNLLQFA